MASMLLPRPEIRITIFFIARIVPVPAHGTQNKKPTHASAFIDLKQKNGI
jgi:hypothetical protein